VAKAGARGYSWPPFEKGNEKALRHGAYSPRRVEPLAAELVEAMRAQVVAEGSTTGYLAEPSFQFSLWAWARAEAKVQLLEEYLADRGSVGLDADGEVSGAAKLLVRYEATAERARDRLGLSPLARARLGRDVAAASVDLAAIAAEEAEREQRGEGVLDVGGDGR
jgi:hypothetical protein